MLTPEEINALLAERWEKLEPKLKEIIRDEVHRQVGEYPLLLAAAQRVDVDPEYKKFVVEEVGLDFDSYLKLDPWSKQAVRDYRRRVLEEVKP